jgi:hypothetical protein
MQVHLRYPRPPFRIGSLLLAMTRMPSLKLSTIREDLTEQCSAILYSYRRNCAAATVPSQVRLLSRR